METPQFCRSRFAKTIICLLSWVWISGWLRTRSHVPSSGCVVVRGGCLWLWLTEGTLSHSADCPLQCPHFFWAFPTQQPPPRMLISGWYLKPKKNWGVWDPLLPHTLLPSPTYLQLLHSLAPLEKERSQNTIKVAFSEPLAFKWFLWGGWNSIHF